MDELLAKTLAGEATAEERALVDTWLAEDKTRRKAFEQAKKIFETSGKMETPNADVDAAWEKVREQMRRGKAVPLHRSVFFRAAASFVLVLGLSAVLYFRSRERGQEITYAQVSLSAGDSLLRDTLSDGSRITLNAGGTLQGAKDFGAAERRVRLQGEAAFEVTHMPQRPFIVETGSKASVRVLGTSFNVRADKDGDVEVLVTTGRVSLRAGNDSLILLPGELGHFYASSGTLEKATNADPNYEAWKTHRLIFKDTELEKVVEVLSKFYRREIRLGSGQIGEMRLTATFENESLDRVLEVISATLDIRVVQNAQGLTLENKSDK